jgi:hypothetical protein
MKMNFASDQSLSGSAITVALALAALLFFAAGPVRAEELRPATLAQWNAYLDSAGVGENAIASRSNFLDLEKRRDAYARLRSGEVLVWRNNGGQTENVPHGLIHDWSGAVFIPNVAISDVLSVTRDYNRYADIYAPAVVDAENLGTAESHGIFSMLMVSKVLFVTAALRGQYKSQYVQVDANRWYSISQSTSLRAIEEYGRSNMRILPPDQGPGYLWRTYSVARYEQAANGVYIEFRVIGLSRSVPKLFGWIVRPVVDQLPADSMRATLEKTRDAVLESTNESSNRLQTGIVTALNNHGNGVEAKGHE